LNNCDPIGKQINETAKDVRKFLNYHLDDYSLGDGQFGILYEISINPGTSQEQISKKRRVDKAFVTKAIKKLMANDYIYRERDENDRRAYCLYCTEKGINFIPKLKKIIKSEIDTTTKGFSEEELENLSSYLKRIRENISKYLEGGENE